MSEQIYTNKVSIVHFHIFMSFYSIYAILLRIRFCRDLRFFCVNFWGQKLQLRNFFDKYDVWDRQSFFGPLRCLDVALSSRWQHLHEPTLPLGKNFGP